MESIMQRNTGSQYFTPFIPAEAKQQKNQMRVHGK